MTHITFGTKLEKWDRARVQPLENLRQAKNKIAIRHTPRVTKLKVLIK